jgi:hypothetical protein
MSFLFSYFVCFSLLLCSRLTYILLYTSFDHIQHILGYITTSSSGLRGITTQLWVLCLWSSSSPPRKTRRPHQRRLTFQPPSPTSEPQQTLDCDPMELDQRRASRGELLKLANVVARGKCDAMSSSMARLAPTVGWTRWNALSRRASVRSEYIADMHRNPTHS